MNSCVDAAAEVAATNTPAMRSSSVWRGATVTLVLFSAVAALAALAGCGSADPEPPFARYVALGDSYTAAPGVDPAPGTGDCGRSTSNYPRLVAARLRVPLTDVSCSGATVGDLLTGQRVTGQVLPAQVDAVSPGTDLVSIGVGANDLDLIGVAVACVRQEAGCADKVARVQRDLGLLPGRIADLVEAVRRKAPDAKVVLVGYPTIISRSAPCPALPLSDQIIDSAIDLNARLVVALKAAARSTKTTFVDLYAATAEHGLCGADPWIAGADGKGAQPFHPTAAEQKAVAAAMIAALD